MYDEVDTSKCSNDVSNVEGGGGGDVTLDRPVSTPFTCDDVQPSLVSPPAVSPSATRGSHTSLNNVIA